MLRYTLVLRCGGSKVDETDVHMSVGGGGGGVRETRGGRVGEAPVECSMPLLRTWIA